MQFDKDDLHILRCLKFYKILSIVCTILGGLAIPQSLWAIFFYIESRSVVRLNLALIGASLVVMAMGYLMYCLIKIIDKFKKEAGGHF